MSEVVQEVIARSLQVQRVPPVRLCAGLVAEAEGVKAESEQVKTSVAVAVAELVVQEPLGRQHQ